MTTWTCADCDTKNRPRARFCDGCGTARIDALSGSSPAKSTEHREFTPPWEQPGFKDSRPEDICGEDGCTKIVRDHIEEFRAIVSRPGTVFTRAKPDPDPDEHAELIRAQAALLRRQVERVPW
jgi:hypothetical protein